MKVRISYTAFIGRTWRYWGFHVKQYICYLHWTPEGKEREELVIGRSFTRPEKARANAIALWRALPPDEEIEL